MENVYLKTKNKKECNGCTLCSLICPKHAISMIEDNEGFIYPEIDIKKCINCGKCLKLCSNHSLENTKDTYKAYAVVNNNKDILMKSTSGGVFYAIASVIFKENNAVCFGASFDKELNVKHMKVESLNDIAKFMGSKYVRSDILGIYEQVRNELENGKKVLFTGTPCQTQGLKLFLNKEYVNLYTCNIICHSNPSPKVYKRYIKGLELNNKSKVIEIRFRTKENGWNNPTPIITFANGKQINENTYQKAFSRGLISRPSCSNCKFIKPQNYADITIGDFWGVSKLTDIKGYENGISLCLANTKKGEEIISNLENVTIIQLDKNVDVFTYNHHEPIKPHRNREKFFKRLDKCKDEDITQYINKMSQERFIRRIYKKIVRR